MGEMACLAVNPQVQSKGDGERILMRIEQRARAAGLTPAVRADHAHRALVPQARLRAGGTLDDLPETPQNLYNWQRKSQVLLKTLG